MRSCSEDLFRADPRLHAATPFKVPTSMYSMKRTTWPASSEVRARDRGLAASFTPRTTTQLILIGTSPARSAAAMPGEYGCASRSHGRSAAERHPRRGLSRLTVTRRRPAPRERVGVLGERVAVRREREVFDSLDAGEPPDQLGQLAPVPTARRRSRVACAPPRRTNTRVSLSISSNVRISRFARNSLAVAETLPRACSTDSGNCSDRSPRCADRGGLGRGCR